MRLFRWIPWAVSLAVILGSLAVAAASARPAPSFSQLHVKPSDLQFDGEKALARTRDLVVTFPFRDAGGPNSLPAANWVAGSLRSLGYDVQMETWQEPLFGKPVDLHNVVAVRKGTGPKTILLAAHLDPAPTSPQGADDGGSGPGVLLELARVLAQEPLQHTVVFLVTDGEEYGMLGARRYVKTHAAELNSVEAAVAIDNVGKGDAFGTVVEMMGQGRGYGPLGLFRLLQDLAPAVDGWAPYPEAPAWQVVYRAVDTSFADQGPLVRAGMPALFLGSTGVWPYNHEAGDTIDKLSAPTMGRVGRMLEGLVRELEAGTSFDPTLRHYLYLPPASTFVPDSPGRYIPGWALTLVQFVLLLPFLLIVWAAVRPVLSRPGLGGALLHVGLWTLPPLAGLLSLYGMTALGIIERFALYPAPPKHPSLYQTDWVAVAGFLGAVALGMAVAALLSRRLQASLAAVDWDSDWRRPGALLVLAAVAALVFLRNGYALLYLLPALYFWAVIGWPGRLGLAEWVARALAPLLLLAGGVSLYALLWAFSQRLSLGWHMLWYFLQMLSFGMIAPYAALAGCAAIGAGLAAVAAAWVGAGADAFVDPSRYKEP